MEKSFEEIKYNDELIAIIIRASYSSDKTTFFSPLDFSQQMGYLCHNKNHLIKPHFHRKIHKEIVLTQEVLFIKKGKIRVDLYNNHKKHITSRELTSGDVVFLCSGGHGFKMRESTEMIEVKQGPYSNREKDKEEFDGI